MERPGSPLASSGKPRLHAERFLLSLFIESLAEAAPAATEPVEDISWKQVRRAEQWIDAHLTEAIGVDDVAAAIESGSVPYSGAPSGSTAAHPTSSRSGAGSRLPGDADVGRPRDQRYGRCHCAGIF